MRAINVGVEVTRETELTVVLAGAGPGSILRITRGDPSDSIALACSGDSWTVTLSPGDYLLTVDSEAPPHGARPLTIRVSAPVVFLSVDAPDGAAEIVAWSASELVTAEPGWPRPQGTRLRGGALARTPVRDAVLTLVDATAGTRGGATAAIHALLIGIDAYPPAPGPDGAIYRDLRGCVRDIVEVEAFLRRDVGVPPERITRLCAATSDSELRAAAAGTPPPTYANIVERWLAIIAAARAGDILYVHYSGHGGRARTLFPAIKRGGVDESLAPCDIHDRAVGKYLRDVEIAALLARSAAKGVLTTLVLDACHSGSATRTHLQARRGERDDTAPRADALATSLVDSPSALEAIARELEHGPRGLEVAWRIDDRGNASALNTVIAACRANESAYEFDIDGIHRQGVLTHFWLDALRRRDAALTYRDAHRQVVAGVQGVLVAQSPVLLGAGDRVVLGTIRLAQARSIAVLGVDGDRVTLAAGESGLIGVGTRLAMIPREVVPELAELSELTHVEVIRVGASSSVARVIADSRRGDVTLGAQGVIVRHAPRMQRNVRLLDEHGTRESAAAFGTLEAAIAADTTNLLAVDPARGADFQVVIDVVPGGAPVFSIVDPAGAPLMHLLPDIAIRERDAALRVKDRLVHLARFSNVLNLTNDDPRSPLANKLRLTLHADVDGRCAPDPLPERPTIRAGTHFYVRIQNRSARPLIAALFDLTSDRTIQMFPQTWELEPHHSQDIRVKALLRPGHRAITDVLKVIATLGLVSFEWMMLPALEHGATRGGAMPPRRPPSNPFEALMKAMQVPRGSTRSFEVARAPTRDWTEARVTVDVVE